LSIILTIDPGNEQSAYLTWDGSKPTSFGILANETLLATLRGCTAGRMVVEMIGHYGTGMPAGKTVFDTCVWIGRFTEAFGADRTEYVLRPTVKAHLCGSARAKDGNVRQALIDRFGGEVSIKKGNVLYKVSKDVWSALAVAAWWQDHQQAPARTEVGVSALNGGL